MQIGPGRSSPRIWATRLALIAFGLSPVLTWAVGVVGAPDGLTVPLRAWFDLQCHNAVLRSFAWSGETLPVCARCLGIYLAFAVAGAISPGRATWRVLGCVLTAGAAAMVVDVVTETRGLRPQWPLVRFLVGAVFAYPAGVAMVRWAREDGAAASDFAKPAPR